MTSRAPRESVCRKRTRATRTASLYLRSSRRSSSPVGPLCKSTRCDSGGAERAETPATLLLLAVADVTSRSESELKTGAARRADLPTGFASGALTEAGALRADARVLRAPGAALAEARPLLPVSAPARAEDGKGLGSAPASSSELESELNTGIGFRGCTAGGFFDGGAAGFETGGVCTALPAASSASLVCPGPITVDAGAGGGRATTPGMSLSTRRAAFC